MWIWNRSWGRSWWIHLAETAAYPGVAVGEACGEVQGFTLEAVEPQQISAHQPISNLLLEPMHFTLTWSQLMLKTSIPCKKLPLDLQIPAVKSQVPCSVSGEVVSNKKQRWLLHLAIPLCYPQWLGSTSFSTQYRPSELCEAVNDDKSAAAGGGHCHKLILAEGCKRRESTNFYRISRPLIHRKFSQNAETSTQLLASNKSSLVSINFN